MLKYNWPPDIGWGGGGFMEQKKYARTTKMNGIRFGMEIELLGNDDNSLLSKYK